MHQTLTIPPENSVSPYVLSLREELRDRSMKRLGRFGLGDLDVEVCQGRDSVWCIIRRDGRGGLALRTASLGAVSFSCRKLEPEPGEVLRLEIESVLGRHVVAFRTSGADLHRLRATVSFTPKADLRVPFMPRDLYPLGAKDDPVATQGNIEAAQRGVNSGLVYFRLDEPQFGSVLYFQNLTALNPYFKATDTKPNGVVGGTWPELGYQAPTEPTHDAESESFLKGGEDYVLSDVILVLRDWAGDNEQEMARQFMQMLGVVYTALELPPVTYRDWVGRADRTLRDLETSEQARREEYGNLYIMPYPDGEYPDVMVQATVIRGLHQWAEWGKEPIGLEAELKKGLNKFYDPKVGTLRRYLPSVGKETGKDPDAVDSWYLYHPMMNLAALAGDGDEQCRDLLLKSVEYGIKAAHHFDYAWPIMYKIDDFAVITEARGDQRFGETDVGGLYAYLMLQCFELTGEFRFVEEARRAIDKAKGLRFDLMYQANLTAWGAVACLRLWRILQDPDYLEQSYVYLAGLFHNCEIWESQIGTAKDFSNFLGATCLHDAPYMAMFECFECFAGMEEYLNQAGPDLEPAVRMLISEYCKYTLYRAWFYYPDALPTEDIQQGEHQSGVVNLKLNFPLEDLYGDGQKAGQVGQEIYGCGAAFVFASRSHHHVDDAPFRLYCNHFIRASEHTGKQALSIQLDGGENCIADLSLVRLPRKRLPKASILTSGGDAIRPHSVDDDRIDFHVPAYGRVILTWE